MSYKKYAIIIGLTFGIAFCTTYLAEATEVAAVDWSVIQRCLYSGVVAVFAWFIAFGTSLKSQLEDIKLENEVLRRILRNE